jgi:hypothetical protein
VGGNVYSIVQFEAPLPSVTYMMQLSIAANGDMGIVPGSLTPIDFSAWGGQLFMCAGQTTPWQSHLAGEESWGVHARDYAGTFASQLSTGITSAVGFNTLSLDTFAMAMRYFGVYPAQMTAAAVTQYFDPYMCVQCTQHGTPLRARKRATDGMAAIPSLAGTAT